MPIRVTSDLVTRTVLDRLLPQHGLSLSGAETVALNKAGGSVSQVLFVRRSFRPMTKMQTAAFGQYRAVSAAMSDRWRADRRVRLGFES
jgi:hypothetical protein